jgi:hypothetical protein
MARVFTDGAEFGDTLFFDLGSPPLSTTTKRSGVYAYNFGYTQTPTKVLPQALDEFYLRFACKDNESSWHGHTIVRWSMGGTQVGELYYSNSQYGTDQKLRAKVGTSIVATSTLDYFRDVWNLVEVHLKIAVSGVLQVKVNGILFIDYSGDTTQSAAFSTVDRIWWSVDGWVAHTPAKALDDIALNDVSGGVDDSWCGNGQVELLKVNAAGDLAEWTPSTGANYQCVDEIPPNGDTDYIHTDVPNEQDIFNLDTFDDTNKIIDRVWADCRAKDYTLGSSTIQLGIKTGGTIYLSGDKVLTSAYDQYNGNFYNNNPFTTNPWTKSDLDALQVVVKATS